MDSLLMKMHKSPEMCTVIQCCVILVFSTFTNGKVHSSLSTQETVRQPHKSTDISSLQGIATLALSFMKTTGNHNHKHTLHKGSPSLSTKTIISNSTENVTEIPKSTGISTNFTGHKWITNMTSSTLNSTKIPATVTGFTNFSETSRTYYVTGIQNSTETTPETRRITNSSIHTTEQARTTNGSQYTSNTTGVPSTETGITQTINVTIHVTSNSTKNKNVTGIPKSTGTSTSVTGHPWTENMTSSTSNSTKIPATVTGFTNFSETSRTYNVTGTQTSTEISPKTRSTTKSSIHTTEQTRTTHSSQFTSNFTEVPTTETSKTHTTHVTSNSNVTTNMTVTHISTSSTNITSFSNLSTTPTTLTAFSNITEVYPTGKSTILNSSTETVTTTPKMEITSTEATSFQTTEEQTSVTKMSSSLISSTSSLTTKQPYFHLSMTMFILTIFGVLLGIVIIVLIFLVAYICCAKRRENYEAPPYTHFGREESTQPDVPRRETSFICVVGRDFDYLDAVMQEILRIVRDEQHNVVIEYILANEDATGKEGIWSCFGMRTEFKGASKVMFVAVDNPRHNYINFEEGDFKDEYGRARKLKKDVMLVVVGHLKSENLDDDLLYADEMREAPDHFPFILKERLVSVGFQGRARQLKFNTRQTALIKKWVSIQ